MDGRSPRALTAAFYQMREIENRWRHYIAAGAVLAPPPAEFEVIGKRIIHFLGPVRGSIIEGTAFTNTWEPCGPWHAVVVTGGAPS